MAKNPKPPLYLDMDTDEALERFIGTDPKEVEKLIKSGKKKNPPPKGGASGGGQLRSAKPKGRKRKSA